MLVYTQVGTVWMQSDYSTNYSWKKTKEFANNIPTRTINGVVWDSVFNYILTSGPKGDIRILTNQEGESVKHLTLECVKLHGMCINEMTGELYVCSGYDVTIFK